MSHVMGNIDGDSPIDVPTMMKMLMVVYNNIRDDETMDEVAEAVSDAICVLGEMRSVAHQVMIESEFDAVHSHLTSLDGARKLC